MDSTPTGPVSETNDKGFGLIEIVVSMFILAILAIAFVPLLVEGLKQSIATSTTATATQLVAERLQLAQAQGPVCSDVAALAGTNQFTDPRGVIIAVTTTVGSCASATTVAVSSVAVRLDTGVPVASANTLVYVGS